MTADELANLPDAELSAEVAVRVYGWPRPDATGVVTFPCMDPCAPWTALNWDGAGAILERMRERGGADFDAFVERVYRLGIPHASDLDRRDCLDVVMWTATPRILAIAAILALEADR